VSGKERDHLAKELDADVTGTTALLVPERFAELLGDLSGLRVEPTEDHHHAGLLRVYLPHTVVGFWYCWSSWHYGWLDPRSSDSRVVGWLIAGTLRSDTTIGELADFITQRIAEGRWPFGGEPPEMDFSHWAVHGTGARPPSSSTSLRPDPPSEDGRWYRSIRCASSA
jgi:hypothetical protein